MKVITISESVDKGCNLSYLKVRPLSQQVAGVEQFGIHIMSLLKAPVIWVIVAEHATWTSNPEN